ncbi:tetratricopeptide repeat protein [Cognatilysobacter terrigena]|uniref:tetratricopeptide repeat protein n=1 Tax=Cognatilysobacter terrigena TaxID=2488749 RepID=UPI00105C23BE|nr:tetratricopeptide repeat protein [Lysobacter terrigena]
MKSFDRRQQLLAAAVAALAGVATLAPVAHAQDMTDTSSTSPAGRRAAREKAKQAEQAAATKGSTAAPTAARYPNATRKDPQAKASAKGAKRLQSLVELYNGKKDAEVRAAADAIIADASATPYEKAFAAQLAAQGAIGAQDYDAALKYIGTAVDADILDNDQHFTLMLQRAQLQVQAKDYNGALASAQRFLDDTKSNDPAALAVKGNALYRLNRYAEAADVLTPAVAAQPDRDDLKQLLADSLRRSGKADEAIRIAEQSAAGNPGDKRAQFNLAQNYIQTKQYDKAVATLERMRQSGQLTDETDYRQLFSLYANMEGKEKETIAVINEGLSKGVLKPDYNVYLSLAQSYYYSDQVEKAIENYNKAGPLGKDGTAYYNLAVLLKNEQRIPEAKAAAQKALDKGLKNSADAKKILATPSK